MSIRFLAHASHLVGFVMLACVLSCFIIFHAVYLYPPLNCVISLSKRRLLISNLSKTSVVIFLHLTTSHILPCISFIGVLCSPHYMIKLILWAPVYHFPLVMTLAPMIFMREFGGSDTSYRIPVSRARNYQVCLANIDDPPRLLQQHAAYYESLQEVLVHIHITFNKPWERNNLRFHLDNTTCDGLVSSSEWEAGAYFADEFFVDNRLMLYAHFEEMESRKPSIETEQKTEAWHWGWLDTEGRQCLADLDFD
jgi:hypothetical protein